MNLETFRKRRWLSADGRSTPIGELSDTHLANIITHCKEQFENYGQRLISLLEQEAASRKLTAAFLSRAPIPWQDVDGKWKRYNFQTQAYEVIGR